jgi:glycerol uptake facilitator-like aquaporin
VKDVVPVVIGSALGAAAAAIALYVWLARNWPRP